MNTEERKTWRVAELTKLGPKPPMWRPFARARWTRAFDRIMAITAEEALELYRKLYNIASVKVNADHPHPILKIVK